MRRSNILEKKGSIKIGRSLLNNKLSSLLKIGIILAIFNLSGNWPNLNNLLKLIDNGKINSLITFL